MVAKVSGTVSLWCGRKETGAKGKRVFLHGQSLHNYHTRTPFLFFCSKGKKRRLNSRGRGLREYQDGKNGKFSIYPTPLISLSLSLSSVCCWRSGTGHTGTPLSLTLPSPLAQNPSYATVLNTRQTNGSQTAISFLPLFKQKCPKGIFPLQKGSTGFPAQNSAARSSDSTSHQVAFISAPQLNSAATEFVSISVSSIRLPFRCQTIYFTSFLFFGAELFVSD